MNINTNNPILPESNFPNIAITEQPQQQNVDQTTAQIGRQKLLEAEEQKKYEQLLEKSQKEAAGLESIFASTNQKYRSAQKQMDKAEVRANFYDLRNSEKTEYEKIFSSYNTQVKPSVLERIKVLKDAIIKYRLEFSLLQKTIKGNDSYWKSYSFFNLELGYLYGANFRLSELNEALKKRRDAIGIKEEETLIPQDSDILPSSVRQNLKKISSDIDELKEEVTICNEALRKDAYEAVKDTDLPKKYYLFHKQQLDKSKQSFTEIEGSVKKRLEELDESIKLEANTPLSLHSLAYKQERIDLQTRLSKFSERKSEIEGLLEQRKKHLSLSEKELAIEEAVTLPDLSVDYNEALSLMKRIINLKENIILSNAWENIATLEQRREAYFQEAKKAKELQQEKAEFEEKKFPARLELISNAIIIYGIYIANINQSLQAIDKHFKTVSQYAEERAKWQVDPLIKEDATSKEENAIVSKEEKKKDQETVKDGTNEEVNKEINDNNHE